MSHAQPPHRCGTHVVHRATQSPGVVTARFTTSRGATLYRVWVAMFNRQLTVPASDVARLV